MEASEASARVWVYGPGRAPHVKPLIVSPTLIGRAEHCDICLDDEAVSRDHLEISLHRVAIVATDLDSLNGTLLNGRRLDRSTRLRPGDVLLLGNHRLEIEVVSEAEQRSGTTRRAVQIPKLSDEELEVVHALVAPCRTEGRLAPATRKEIAAQLNMSETKVKRRMASIAQKLGVLSSENRDRPRLVAERALEVGLYRRR